MTMQKVTLELPEPIVSNLPPTPDNAPVEMQAELLQMQTKDNTELLSIAQSQIVVEQQQRHVELLEKNQNGELTPSERQELSELRIAADRLMLQKASAWSILRWRGHKLPNLNELLE